MTIRENVLVAGSGNITGMNIISALKTANIPVYGCDFNTINPANTLCNNFIIHKCDSNEYIIDILDIIEKYHITHIIASNDHDVRALAEAYTKLADRKVSLNGYSENILNWLDKEKTATLFSQNGFLTPPILNEKFNFPYVLRKNKMGNKQKFVHIVNSENDLHKIQNEDYENGIITRYIKGKEYTIDVLSDSNGKVISAIPRLRIEVKGGMVHHAKIINNQKLINLISRMCIRLKITGISCIQCIENNEGEYYFLEVNPRPGSGMDLSINAGVNIPKLWFEKATKAPEPKWGLQMIRYFNGYYFM
ncbi:ATP-grasp domain-containing protein [Parabacteroides faecis]|uniref:ATP-grasp domain-containing protein n=1 Tax=Parabacteroides TaxID=375288 RepID=UPI000EFF6821|nr:MULTISPECIES: ATP-grasp domain-containing protein [Parabacteroides]MBC8618452.1 ATP-grasp domain-containing protein [Parabacteroides faecis]RHR94832.1 ATP-grasp domain-containing protein [Parabacteroides sp. AF14-59]